MWRNSGGSERGPGDDFCVWKKCRILKKGRCGKKVSGKAGRMGEKRGRVVPVSADRRGPRPDA